MNDKTRYLLVGSGRTHTHFSHYFSLLGISFDSWNRSQSIETLQALKKQASHVLVLISDAAIAPFAAEHLQDFNGVKVHFSGVLEIPGLISAHPLMSFSSDMYELSDYQEIPFVLTTQTEFSEVLPLLPNRSYRIKPEQKAFYHALCVLSGNFTTLLWSKMDQGVQQLGLPSYVVHPYLKRIAQNLIQNPEKALTGPLARKDLKTVQANYQALDQDNFQKIYRSFVEVFFPEAASQLENRSEKK